MSGTDNIRGSVPEGGTDGAVEEQRTRDEEQSRGVGDGGSSGVADPRPDELLDEPTSVWGLAARRFMRRKLGMLGLLIVVAIAVVALFAPAIAPYDPLEQLDRTMDVQRREAPSQDHLMGLDSNARDQFSRVVYGARVSLPLGFSTVLVAIIVGALIGAIAGYFGGWADNVLMRLMDVILGFPALILAIAIVFLLGPGIRNTLLAIAVVTLPQYARVMRSSVLSIKEVEYVSASEALGASSWRILATRILPNSLTPLVVLGTLGIASAILEAAALSFLGLGAQPPTPEWGAMLAQEYTLLRTSPHLVIYPGLAIMVTVLGFNLLGDGLRDALDPSLNE